MARNNKVSMPSSTAGLTRFYDEYKSKIQFNPSHLVVMIVIVIVFYIFIYALG